MTCKCISGAYLTLARMSRARSLVTTKLYVNVIFGYPPAAYSELPGQQRHARYGSRLYSITEVGFYLGLYEFYSGASCSHSPCRALE